MRIEFNAKTNKDYVMINTATFYLKEGGTITLDRDSTNYSINNGILSMEWDGVYLWEINGENIFDYQTTYVSDGIVNLLDGAWVELCLEDDADEDYKVTDVKWSIYGDGKQVSGTDNPLSC